MNKNAYILERTMEEYDLLKTELMNADFEIEKQKNNEDVTVTVPFEKVDAFVKLIQKHLNAPFNYVDIKFPERHMTVIAFLDRVWEVNNPIVDQEAKKWALSIGLPEKEAGWPTFFD